MRLKLDVSGFRPFLLLILLPMLLILLADSLTQLGFAHGVLYSPLLLLTLLLRRRGFIYFSMLVALVFTWLGYLISPPAPEGFSFFYVLANRLLASGVIVATGVLLLYLHRVADERRNQQTRMLQQQQEQEQLLHRLNAVLESIADGFVTLDTELRFTYVNDAAVTVLQRSDETVLGQRIQDNWLVKQSPSVIDSAQRVLLKHQPEILKVEAATGAWYSVSFYPFEGGMSVYFRDITQEQQAQQELTLLRMAVSRLNDVIIITEAEPLTYPGPRIVFVNEAFERITGYSKEEVIGKSPRLLQGPDTSPAEMKRIGNALKQWQTVRGELLNYRKNGEAFWFELDIVPLADETGWFTHWVAVERDITQQKELQLQLQHIQRMESVGQLTGGIAHDFNNLLTVINGNLELLVEQLENQPRLQALAKTSARAADRGTQLTRSLLTFARKQMLQPVETRINRLIQDMMPLLKSSVGERMEIRLQPAEGLWSAMVDESYLESSLLNLVINARDAMPEGGVVLLETANVTLDKNYAARHPELIAGDYVMVAVSDNGSGIPADIIDRIFDPFFTTKDKTKGTGLGLSMVFGFIKQSGGHINVYSEAGQGTCFRLYLPRAGTTGAENETSECIDCFEKAGKTLLVAEDNELVRDFAAAQLQAAGYQVVAVETGDQALALLEAGEPVDLLFTDVIMPGQLNGLQLAEAARKLRPDLPIIFTSGFTEQSIPHLLGEESSVKLLSKPYKRQELLQMIAVSLSAAAD